MVARIRILLNLMDISSAIPYRTLNIELTHQASISICADIVSQHSNNANLLVDLDFTRTVIVSVLINNSAALESNLNRLAVSTSRNDIAVARINYFALILSSSKP